MQFHRPAMLKLVTVQNRAHWRTLRHAAGLQHLLRVFIRKEGTGVIDYQEELEQYKERIDELATQKRYAELRDLFLPMEPADIALLLEEGKLPGTTKKESGHGMGLANVQDVLRKYGAEYTVSCRDRWFRFTCAIPCAVHDMSTDNL